MTITEQISGQLREVFFGKNWTASNLQQHVAGISWVDATTKVHSFNTIAALVYHSYYYVAANLQVLKGNPLDAHDKYSFDHPAIYSQEDWDGFLNKVWLDVEELATLTAALPDDQLWNTFVNEAYGNYYRNLNGVIQHTHYHLGQIVLIKKLLAEQ
ncbi:DUF1572 domain-containing protein [Segetibacter sp. 3557_3]|uniref:DUF1572 domain-containing protein n=1 Tax=Segetibacter sp. 3557_3 TaxID=2547429 RepID=UPI001058951B|nr:DUF1572 domain-containing protein [Segetibacter sp. 3557_3]TDH28572.1 DUF1572 domain-containing protein [Segetibacter sp. 3557_3]